MEAKCIPVRVGVRSRPLVQKEVLEGCQTCVRFLDSCQVVVGEDKAFTYDYVFPPETAQKTVYETTVSKLIPEIFKGYNVTVLAYGQTGSGKTFSMGTSCGSSWQGSDSNAGIIPRAVYEIFEGIEKHSDKTFVVKASFLEIYKEDILDLLSKQQEPLTIREDSSGAIKIPNLQEIHVHNLTDTLGLLESGSAVRRTAATGMNAHSSRSHAIFTLSVEQQMSGDTNDTMLAKFHMVDLAGSERAGKTKAQGERLKEGININRGLLSLGNVISALCDDAPHVPYRDSKLTRLLQDSLGGNSNTVMLACISPADSNFEETLNTLRYADRARKIKNKPIVNRDPQALELIRLNELVQQLRAQLQEQGGQSPEESRRNVESDRNTGDLEALLEEKTRLLESSEKLNKQLKEELHAALDQLSSHTERHILDQLQIEQLQKLNKELSSKIQDLQCATNEAEKAEILKDIQMSLHDYKEEERLRNDTFRIETEKCEEPIEESNAEDRSEEDAEDVTAAELNRTFRRAAMSRQLDELNRILQAKEELASKMTLNEGQLEVVRQQYEASQKQLEEELVGLKKEKDELTQALLTVKASSVPKGISEQRRKRIQELEASISNLKKKLTEQSRLVKMKEETERSAKKLKEEITTIKQTRVRLMRQLKEESERHRLAQLQMDRKVRALQLREQRQAMALAKLERQSALRVGVLQRRMNEALAVKQRLEAAAAKRREWRKHRGEGNLEGLTGRVKTWLSEELAVLSDSKKVEHHLGSLLEDRKMVADQLNAIKKALADDPSPEDCDSLREKQKELEKEIKERTAQIKELQQKLLDVDPEKQMYTMMDGVKDVVEAQVIASCLLKVATEKDAEAYVCKMKQEESTREVEELKASVEELKRKMEQLEKNSEIKMVELEKEHQEKMVYLLKHSTNVTLVSNPDMDASLHDRYKAQECEISRLQYVHEELRKKTEEIDQLKEELNQARNTGGKTWLEDLRTSAKKGRKQPSKPKVIEPVLFDISYDSDFLNSSDNQQKDPDWSLDHELKAGTKRKSSEDEKPQKSLKRSSSSSFLVCKCRGQCSKRCGCLRKGRSCVEQCSCKGSCKKGTSMEEENIEEEPLVEEFKENMKNVLSDFN